jgi:cytidyltransferase-like protein
MSNLRVAVSGGFDPIHIGHIRMLYEARQLGDSLIVILNNDNWLMAKKGFIFMPQEERRKNLLQLRCVDSILLSFHPKKPIDMSVSNELEYLMPYCFANGGDRSKVNTPEFDVCEANKIIMAFDVGGKKYKVAVNQ